MTISSGREYFKNVIQQTYQQTGAIGAIETISERNSFVSSVKQFESGYVTNWQNIIYPLLAGVDTSDYKQYAGVRSGPWAEYDGLDAQYGGLHGWTLTAEPWATADGLECLWDSTNNQPSSITAALYCLSSKIDEIEILSNTSNGTPYDDSELRAKILCLEDDFLSIYKDTIGCDAVLTCSPNKKLEFSILRHIYEIFEQVIDGGPDIPNIFECETAYPALSIQLLLSNVTFDILIDQDYVENLGTDLQCIRDFVGLSEATKYLGNCLPEYGSNLNFILNGDNIINAIFKLDQVLGESSTASLQKSYDDGPEAIPGYIQLKDVTVDGGTGTFILSNSMHPSTEQQLIDQAPIDAEAYYETYLVSATALNQIHIDTAKSDNGSVIDPASTTYFATIIGQPAIDSAFQTGYTDYLNSLIAALPTATESTLNKESHFVVQDKIRLDDTNTRSPSLITVGEGDVSRNLDSGDLDTYGSLYKNASVNIHRSILNITPRDEIPGTVGEGASYGSKGYLGEEDQTGIWSSTGNFSDGLDHLDCDQKNIGDNNLYYRKPNNGEIYKLNLCASEIALGDLSNTSDLKNATDSQIIKYDGDNNVWVSADLNLDSLGDVDLSTPAADGDILFYDETTNTWVPGAPGSTTGDNLGNHIATQDLDMSNHDINRVQTITSSYSMSFESHTDASDTSSVCNYNFGGIVGKGNGAPASINLGTGGSGGFFNIQPKNGATSQQIVKLPGSNPTSTGQVLSIQSLSNNNSQIELEWSSPNTDGDNLGNHIATQNLNMSDYNIVMGDGSITFSEDGVNGAEKIRGVDESLIFTTEDVDRLVLSADGLYPDSNTNLDLGKPDKRFESAKLNSLYLHAIGSQTNEYLSFHANSATTSYSLIFPATDGAANQTLVTDGSGNLSWLDLSTGDNLGNHTAEQDLDMNSNAISGVTDITTTGGVSVGSNLSVGGNADVTGDLSVYQNITASGSISSSGNITSGGSGSFTGDITATGNVNASGQVQIGTEAGLEGSIRYNATSNQFEGHDGLDWVPFSGGIGSSSSSLQVSYDSGVSGRKGFVTLRDPISRDITDIGSFVIANGSNIFDITAVLQLLFDPALTAAFETAVEDEITRQLLNLSFISQTDIDYVLTLTPNITDSFSIWSSNPNYTRQQKDEIALAFDKAHFIVSENIFQTLIDQGLNVSETELAIIQSLLGGRGTTSQSIHMERDPHFIIDDAVRYLNSNPNETTTDVWRWHSLLTVGEHELSRKLSNEDLATYGDDYSYGVVDVGRSILSFIPRAGMPGTFGKNDVYGSENYSTGYDQTGVWVSNGYFGDGDTVYLDCNSDIVGDNNLYYRKPSNGEIYKLNICPSEDIKLGDLKDVKDGSGDGNPPTGKEVPIYDGNSSEYVIRKVNLEDLGDINFGGKAIADGEVLKYVASTQEWTSGTVSGNVTTSGVDLAIFSDGNGGITENQNISTYSSLNNTFLAIGSHPNSESGHLNLLNGGNLIIGQAGGNYSTSFGASGSQANDIFYVLPDAAGTQGQALTAGTVTTDSGTGKVTVDLEWTDASGDNLGNHIAEQDLNMDLYNIDGVRNLKFKFNATPNPINAGSIYSTRYALIIDPSSAASGTTAGNNHADNRVVIGGLGAANLAGDTEYGANVSRLCAENDKSFVLAANDFANTSYVQINPNEDELIGSSVREGIELRLRESANGIASVSIKSKSMNGTDGITPIRSPKLKFYNPAGYSVSMKAPDSGMTVNANFVLPAADGTSGQVLSTDGSGNLSFVDGGTGGASPSGANGYIQIVDALGTSFSHGNWLMNVSGHIIPDTNDTYDLGSAEKKVRDLYLGPNSLKLAKSSAVTDSADFASIGTDGINGYLVFNSLTDSKGATKFYDFLGGDNVTAELRLFRGSISSSFAVSPSQASNQSLILPGNIGTAGQVLGLGSGTSSSEGELVWLDAGTGGGISAVVEDTTPSLGGDLNASSNSITNVGYTSYDTTSTHEPGAGEVTWDQDEETLDIGLGGTTLHLGQDTLVNVRNNSATVAIAKGTALQAAGSLGSSGRILVEPMDASSSGDPLRYIGLAAEDIPVSGDGKAISYGKIRQIDTSGALASGVETWNDGDILWLDEANPGLLTKVQPEAPSLKIATAFVISAHASTGVLMVRANGGIDLHNNHRVHVQDLQSLDLLFWNATLGRWENKSLTSSGNTISIQEGGGGSGDITLDLLAGDIAAGTYGDANKVVTSISIDSYGRVSAITLDNYPTLSTTRYTDTLDYGASNNTTINPHRDVFVNLWYSSSPAGGITLQYNSTTNGGWQAGDRITVKNLSLDGTATILSDSGLSAARIKTLSPNTGISATPIVSYSVGPGKTVEGYFDGTYFIFP